MNIVLLQYAGIVLSTALVIWALAIRYSRSIDTTALSADWSLQLIAFAGLCMMFYFYKLDDPTQLKTRGTSILVGTGSYVFAICIWFFGARKTIEQCNCDEGRQRVGRTHHYHRHP